MYCIMKMNGEKPLNFDWIISTVWQMFIDKIDKSGVPTLPDVTAKPVKRKKRKNGRRSCGDGPKFPLRPTSGFTTMSFDQFPYRRIPICVNCHRAKVLKKIQVLLLNCFRSPTKQLRRSINRFVPCAMDSGFCPLFLLRLSARRLYLP
jgi:hypothetical protein